MEGRKPRNLLPALPTQNRSFLRQAVSTKPTASTTRTQSKKSPIQLSKRISVTPTRYRPVPVQKPRPHHSRYPSTQDTPAAEHECPWTLAEISLGKCIGKGSLGRVVLGQTATCQVAVKIMEKRQMRVKKIAEAERVILEQLHHALMVTYFGCLEDAERLYLVLEYLPNGDLFHLMRRKRLKPRETKFYATEVVAGLRSLHSLQIVYRDLKPENLMLHSSGHLRFIDFGFAKRLVSERTSSVLGSPEYMAPELVMKRPHGLAVDCWSLGVLLYELHCHHPPFEGETPMEVYEKVVSGVYELPNHLDSAIKDLIRRLLNPEPRLRLDVEAVMRHGYFQGTDWIQVDELLLEAPVLEGVPEKAREEFQTNLFS